MELGIVWPPTWLELAWIWPSSNFCPTQAKFSTVWPPQPTQAKSTRSYLDHWMVFLQAGSTWRYRLATRRCKLWFNLYLGLSWFELGVPFGQGLTDHRQPKLWVWFLWNSISRAHLNGVEIIRDSVQENHSIVEQGFSRIKWTFNATDCFICVTCLPVECLGWCRQVLPRCLSPVRKKGFPSFLLGTTTQANSAEMIPEATQLNTRHS